MHGHKATFIESEPALLHTYLLSLFPPAMTYTLPVLRAVSKLPAHTSVISLRSDSHLLGGRGGISCRHARPDVTRPLTSFASSEFGFATVYCE